MSLPSKDLQKKMMSEFKNLRTLKTLKNDSLRGLPDLLGGAYHNKLQDEKFEFWTKAFVKPEERGFVTSKNIQLIYDTY